MSKPITALEQALHKSENSYRACARNVIDFNKDLEKLEQNFLEAKQLILAKIDRNIDARDKADKETQDLKKAITILQNHEIPEWGTKEKQL